MGLYSEVVQADVSLTLLAKANTYTMYERGGIWYVNFRAEGRQFRLSTGIRDYTDARAMVETYRATRTPIESRQVNDEHLYRMIERARYRNRKKGTPVTIGINDLRRIAARCRGYCEVTGHRLEDTGPFRASLDRIDSLRGYVPDNVRIVCLITNTAMLHYGEAAFAELAISYCRARGILPASPPLC